ncbi:MAG TPA: transglycosylase domain-containing protein, partial [Ktedonobacterales bacterium]
MGNDWQDPRQKDRRLYNNARQPQDPQSSQSWDSSFQQDWRPQATGGPPSSRGPENRQPPGPRQTGGLAPHNGSGMLSRARNGGTSGPLGPQQGRTSGPLPPSSRGFTPPGNDAAPRRSGAMRDYDAPDMPPQRPSGRQTSGRQSDPFSEPPMAGERSGRRISGPTERAHNGGGLLSFARAASSTMRAIITGKHRASRTSQVEPAMMDGPPPFLPEGEEEQPHPKPYRRSRTRLVIHKRLERRSRSSKRLLIASIVTGFLVLLVLGGGVFGASNVSAFYQDTQGKLGALADPNGFSQTTRFYDRNGNLLWEMLDNKNNNADYRTYVPYGLIPKDVINATVDTEDKTFWTNSGVDVNSIIRAAIANVTNQEITQGGSTITQQLIKNAFFVDPNTGVAQENYQRKIQEALMSYAVTQQYSKQDIL